MIYEVRALIVAHIEHPGAQHVMRLHAPEIAHQAQPGQFIHIQVAAPGRLRRPVSLMLADPETGHIDILFKVVGEGTRLLAQKQQGEHLQLCGPIGTPFDLETLVKGRVACVGGGVGIPPMIFAADRLKAMGGDVLLFAGSEQPFPFALQPSTFMLPGISPQVHMTIRSLEERDIPCRLSSNNPELPGCYHGYVPTMLEDWLQAVPAPQRQNISLIACGPHPMLQAVAACGERHGLNTWVSLEEYMACGIGGCAGCVVKTNEHDGEHYRRVCVDGPVFDARSVCW